MCSSVRCDEKIREQLFEPLWRCNIWPCQERNEETSNQITMQIHNCAVVCYIFEYNLWKTDLDQYCHSALSAVHSPPSLFQPLLPAHAMTSLPVSNAWAALSLPYTHTQLTNVFPLLAAVSDTCGKYNSKFLWTIKSAVILFVKQILDHYNLQP